MNRLPKYLCPHCTESRIYLGGSEVCTNCNIIRLIRMKDWRNEFHG